MSPEAEIQAAELATHEKIAAKGFRTFSEDFFRDMFPVPFDRTDEIIERACKLSAEIGSTLFPRISRWDAQHMNAALAAVQVPLMVIQSTYMGPTLKRESLQAGQSSTWLDRVREYAPNARIEIVSRGRALRSHGGGGAGERIDTEFSR